MAWCILALLLVASAAADHGAVDCQTGASEECEQNLQSQSLLQHATVISKEETSRSRERVALCDTVKTPPYSPHADELNKGYFYVIAMTNDTAENVYSYMYKWLEKYNFRVYLDGKYGNMKGWWMESEDPSSRWLTFDLLSNTSDPKALATMALDTVVCKERNCQYSQWHAEVWKGHPLLITWACVMDSVGNEILWGGPPGDPELLPYVTNLIKAQGGGLERFLPLTPIKFGPHEKPCPCGLQD